MIATQAPRYRFREGALDHIMRSRNLTTDSQLAAAIGIKEEDLQRVRAGALVSARLALKVSAPPRRLLSPTGNTPAQRKVNGTPARVTECPAQSWTWTHSVPV